MSEELVANMLDPYKPLGPIHNLGHTCIEIMNTSNIHNYYFGHLITCSWSKNERADNFECKNTLVMSMSERENCTLQFVNLALLMTVEGACLQNAGFRITGTS